MLKQAVILAGGRGTRLKPLTDTMPKPMIPIKGKPFLEYLIENLRDQGIEKVLLLLGYLPHIIKSYFGDGSSFGIEIDYSITDMQNETGRRIKLAEDKIEQFFLLMYCDNYWPMRLKHMWAKFINAGVAAQITVYANKDNYTKHNVRMDDKGLVVAYDKNRELKNLQGVDIGYAIMSKEILTFLPYENVSFEKTVYSLLIESGQLSAYLTDHRYYSIGSHGRLPLTELFFSPQRAVILDRDGVLNEKPMKAQYVKTWDEFKWLPGAIEAIRLIKKAGFAVIIITNQAGVGRGMMTESELLEIHEQMKATLAENGVFVDAIYYCPHGWDNGCDCRKPKPGMLFQAQHDFHLDLSRTFFIGDDIRDQQAGEAAGCKTLLVSPKMSLLQLVRKKILGR